MIIPKKKTSWRKAFSEMTYWLVLNTLQHETEWMTMNSVQSGQYLCCSNPEIRNWNELSCNCGKQQLSGDWGLLWEGFDANGPSLFLSCCLLWRNWIDSFAVLQGFAPSLITIITSSFGGDILCCKLLLVLLLLSQIWDCVICCSSW